MGLDDRLRENPLICKCHAPWGACDIQVVKERDRYRSGLSAAQTRIKRWTAQQPSEPRLLLLLRRVVDRQRRMLRRVRRIHVAAAVISAVFALRLRAGLDVIRHARFSLVHSQDGCHPNLAIAVAVTSPQNRVLKIQRRTSTSRGLPTAEGSTPRALRGIGRRKHGDALDAHHFHIAEWTPPFVGVADGEA